MKSFALLAAFAAGAMAQSLGSCAQTCADNMASIAENEFKCPTGDISCFCSKANWAYGIRDCSAEACQSDQAQQAVQWAFNQCAAVASTAKTSPTGLTILASAASSPLPTASGSNLSSATATSSGASNSASDKSASASSSVSSAIASIISGTGSAQTTVARTTSTSGVTASTTTQGGSGNAGMPMATAMPLAAGAGIVAMFLF